MWKLRAPSVSVYQLISKLLVAEDEEEDLTKQLVFSEMVAVFLACPLSVLRC